MMKTRKVATMTTDPDTDAKIANPFDIAKSISRNNSKSRKEADHD